MKAEKLKKDWSEAIDEIFSMKDSTETNEDLFREEMIEKIEMASSVFQQLLMAADALHVKKFGAPDTEADVA